MSQVAEVTLSAGPDCVVSPVPLRMKRRAGHKQVIAPGGTELASAGLTSSSQALALTIARAHRWQRLLESGRYTTIGLLAREVGVDNSYLARLLRLTLVAPDIIGSILDGNEPEGLSLQKLYRVPDDWEEQRRAYAAGGNGQR